MHDAAFHHDSYLRWSKLHPRQRFELASNTMPPPAGPAFLDDLHGLSFPLAAEGPYGHPELIAAIADRFGVAAPGIVPVPGASSGNFIALSIVAQRGDTILLEHPVYEPIARAATFLGLTIQPLYRASVNAFDVDLEQIEEGLRRGAKAVYLTNIHNPSGQLVSRGRMADIAAICGQNEALLVVDELYLEAAAICGLDTAWTAAEFGPHVVVVNSLTKLYGLPGLRAGWIMTGDALADRARAMMDLLSVDNASPSAALACRAFDHLPMLRQRYRDMHQRGQEVFRPWLEAQSHLSGYPSHGAIFEFLRLPSALTAVRLDERLREAYGVQVVPGSFFGLPDHIRLSLTLPQEELREALPRISQAAQELVARKY